MAKTAADRRILVGVTGGIAAFKACGIVSRLVQHGYDVQVIMTDAALRFLTPLSFAALTRNPVITSLWDRPEEIPHIRAVREADVFLIVPATAQTIAKIALGFADDVLTNAALAARVPIILAPAMNSAMYEHAATQEHLALLRRRGVMIVEPESGFLAERENGVGRLAEETRIYAVLDEVLTAAQALAGLHILLTAGPTREAVDPVRFISNAATGATGLELAAAAQRRGADVRVILGPTHLARPAGVEILDVVSAQDMCDAALRDDFTPDIIIASAAVADERPLHIAAQKRKKRDGPLRNLELMPTVDVLVRLREQYPRAFVVGFAAETEQHLANAYEKLVNKRLDAIITNDVGGGRGFGAQPNAVTILTATQTIALDEVPKNELARKIWDTLTTIRSSNG